MTTFDHTRRACYTGYVTQAIVNNLAPLLFIVFQDRYGSRWRCSDGWCC